MIKLERIDKPWGYEEVWAKTDTYVGKILSITKENRLSLQYHEKKEETIRVLSGKMILQFGYKKEKLKTVLLVENDTFHIRPGLVHRFEAREEDVIIIEVSTPELDDVVRLEDDYDRV
jgi:mannose-6-phosphate isomerase-like protein (cupin superfamily)